MDVAPDPDERGCECPADGRIARHFDAKASEGPDDGWETGLIAVSRRLSDALMSCPSRWLGSTPQPRQRRWGRPC
jgi:hypothetical protein